MRNKKLKGPGCSCKKNSCSDFKSMKDQFFVHMLLVFDHLHEIVTCSKRGHVKMMFVGTFKARMVIKKKCFARAVGDEHQYRGNLFVSIKFHADLFKDGVLLDLCALSGRLCEGNGSEKDK